MQLKKVISDLPCEVFQKVLAEERGILWNEFLGINKRTCAMAMPMMYNEEMVGPYRVLRATAPWQCGVLGWSRATLPSNSPSLFPWYTSSLPSLH